ncbi:MAG: DUF4922 domain-containing protein [Myxococcota bacterium]
MQLSLEGPPRATLDPDGTVRWKAPPAPGAEVRFLLTADDGEGGLATQGWVLRVVPPDGPGRRYSRPDALQGLRLQHLGRSRARRPGPRAGARPAATCLSLLLRARALAVTARAAGVLEPLGCAIHHVDGFQVRVLAGFERKPKATAASGPRPDPFLPPYPALLHVADWPPAHALLLNRYPVLADHLLLVTLRDEPQEAPPSAGDLDALERLLAIVDGLGFYNGGVAAGASQPHRHLQLVPADAVGPMPLEAPLADAVGRGLDQVPSLPFAHAVGPPDADLDALFAAAGADPRAPGAHSLLATRRWRLLVPRTAGEVDGMPVNSLAYVGLLAVTSEAQLAALARMGPWEVLSRAASPRR